MLNHETRRAVHALLARHRPVTVRAYLGPMKTAPYQVAERRRRFPAVLDWLDSVDASRGGFGWDRLELVMGDGEVRHYTRPTEPAPPAAEVVRMPDVEVLPPPAPGVIDPMLATGQLVAMVLGFLERILTLCMHHERSGVREALRANVGMTREYGQAVRLLGHAYQEHSKVAVRAAETRVDAEHTQAEVESALEALRAAQAEAAEGGAPGALGDIKGLMEALPAIAQAVPMVRQMLGGILPGAPK